MNFSTLMQSHATRVNQALTQFIKPQSFQTPLVDVMKHGALLGGKRLRPFLVYATGEMFGVSQQVLDAPAAALECIHAYSLIHDDLPAMDDDALRRGQPTCHIKFGEANAILAGDALQTLAFSILSEAPMPGVASSQRLSMVRELAQASGMEGMCAGQALDLAAEGQPVTLETLERIHSLKTGALIRVAARLGALSAGDAGRRVITQLDTYAAHIGLAFQVQDDILDVVGDTAIIGKSQGRDLQLGKSTYPALLGLEQAREKARDLCNSALNALSGLKAQSLDTSALEALARYVIERDK